MPPTYTNQEQSETTHQSKPISQQRYTQEDNPTSPNHLSTNPNLPLPDFPPVHLDSPLLLAQHPRNPATRFACPPTPIMSPSNHTLCAVHNWLRVANTREEGSDSEEPGERAEKNEDSTEDTRENESQPTHDEIKCWERRATRTTRRTTQKSEFCQSEQRRTRTPRRHIRIFCIECRSVANDRFLESNARQTERQHSAELTRLKEENARLTETMSDFQVRAASLAADESTLERLTTERDTLKANLTATNQSLDESNQRIYTHSSEADWVGVSESAAQLASIEKFHSTIVPSRQPHYLDDIGDEIGSYEMLFTESDTRKVRESSALEKG
ncbi:hypothetical protein BLNAU_15206 [Blattamonas nauphoetae]|uniref:Uncharacterized protein n=1 Tax=Blattamonas nauphoetae TaxID=2049346 RepID=A0ABQ9XHP7_9EUKA|nr:hypothetical protein BLNAU_15206 [Blattamonas nauphoetae]